MWIGVAGETVQITWAERDELLERLQIVIGDGPTVRKIANAGQDGMVELDPSEYDGLRMAIDLWHGVDPENLPHGMRRLFAALTRAEPDDDIPPEVTE